MKVDMYGSRQFLMNLLNNRDSLNIEVNNAYIGTSFESQMTKATKLDGKIIKKKLTEYEQLEVFIDSRKLFRRLQSISRSNIIFLDFLSEGIPVIKINDFVLLKNVSLKKIIENIDEAVDVSNTNKVKNLDQVTSEFIKYLSTYDLVIINKLRLPKYKSTVSGMKLKSNIDQINFQNFYTESFEDLIISKMHNVEVIEEYDIPANLRDGYYYDKDYITYFKESALTILNRYVAR